MLPGGAIPDQASQLRPLGPIPANPSAHQEPAACPTDAVEHAVVPRHLTPASSRPAHLRAMVRRNASTASPTVRIKGVSTKRACPARPTRTVRRNSAMVFAGSFRAESCACFRATAPDPSISLDSGSDEATGCRTMAPGRSLVVRSGGPDFGQRGSIRRHDCRARWVRSCSGFLCADRWRDDAHSGRRRLHTPTLPP